MKRWLIRGSLLLLLLGIVAQPAVHWRLRGWAKGESFFLGRPTSYWRAEIITDSWYYYGLAKLCLPRNGNEPGPTTAPYFIPRSTGGWQGWVDSVLPKRQPSWEALKTDSPEIWPLLHELQQDSEKSVRDAAKVLEWTNGIQRPQAAGVD